MHKYPVFTSPSHLKGMPSFISLGSAVPHCTPLWQTDGMTIESTDCNQHQRYHKTQRLEEVVEWNDYNFSQIIDMYYTLEALLFPSYSNRPNLCYTLSVLCEEHTASSVLLLGRLKERVFTESVVFSLVNLSMAVLSSEFLSSLSAVAQEETASTCLRSSSLSGGLVVVLSLSQTGYQPPTTVVPQQKSPLCSKGMWLLCDWGVLLIHLWERVYNSTLFNACTKSMNIILTANR